jgi:hypothetical protein
MIVTMHEEMLAAEPRTVKFEMAHMIDDPYPWKLQAIA